MEWSLLQAPVYGVLLSLVSALFHMQLNQSLWRGTLRPVLTPTVLLDDQKTYLNWKWRNFLISFIHASVTGVGSVICMSFESKLVTNVIDTYLEAGYLLTCFSHGYFIYDTSEMIKNHKYKGCKELIIHHILILMCFSITVFQSKYVGYCCIALFIEISNIFLHFRQLLLLGQMSKDHRIYRINSWLNIVIFVVVRGVTLFWLWYTLVIFSHLVPSVIKMIASVSLTGFSIITCVLFWRLFCSDFLESQSDQKSKQINKEKSQKVKDNFETNEQEKEQKKDLINSGCKFSEKNFSQFNNEKAVRFRFNL